MRAVFYFMMAALRDEESQEKGTVGIFYAIGQKTYQRPRVGVIIIVNC
jgi:hypothetical protein